MTPTSPRPGPGASPLVPPGRRSRPTSARDLSDEELDRYILARLRMAGVSLDPLPAHDPSAPADRERILASGRSLLRGGAAALSALELDPQEWPPVLYPASLPPVEEG